jgi:hypothetical protein
MPAACEKFDRLIVKMLDQPPEGSDGTDQSDGGFASGRSPVRI